MTSAPAADRVPREGEDIDTLRFFVARHLDRAYPHLTLVEGNDRHRKSHFVEPGVDPEKGKAANDLTRRRQVETIARIVAARTRPDGRFLVLGNMNDAPDAPALARLATSTPHARHLGSHIDRRTRHGGDGSDHDPAWVVLDL
ncbi:hypothetical protein [Streptomyces sp. NPDC018031]|uniref:hypothetical protein n=1 Tax=Streptomyces sp. NPDC018031 TaxID=3365033 RepID=UPI00379AE562